MFIVIVFTVGFQDSPERDESEDQFVGEEEQWVGADEEE